MTFFRDLFSFLKRERVWSLLLIFIVLVFVFFFQSGKMRTRHESPALQELHRAENQLKAQIHAKGGVQEYLASRPRLLKIFSLFTSFLLGVLSLGFVLDLVWLIDPRWRVRLRNETGPPGTPGWGLGTVFKSMVLFTLATLALSFFMSLVKHFFFSGASGNLILLLHTTFSDLFVVGIVVHLISRAGGDWRDLGFRGIQWLRDLWFGLLGYLAVLPLFALVLIGLLLLVQLFHYEPPPHPLVEIFLEEEKRAPWVIGYSVFLACVAGPVFEEIFFRGFCYPAFKKRWGMRWALTLSAAFFSLIHQNVFAFFPVFVLGLGLGYLYEKRGNLVAPIVLHVVHNSIFISYFFLAKKILEGNL